MSRAVLVVCTANRCRSPMAEALIQSRIEASELGEELNVRGAGTWAEPGLPPTRHAVEALGEVGLDWSGDPSRPVDGDEMARASLVLVMTRGHAEALRAEFPDHADKVVLMSELAGGRWDIVDPVGGSLDDYRATRDELDRLIAAGWERIAGRE